MKYLFKVILIFLAVATWAALLTMLVNINQINHRDRNYGSCSDMYEEGYNWGLAQYPLQFSTWEQEDVEYAKQSGIVRTKAYKMERLYDYMKEESNV